MKKILLILATSIFLFSCSNEPGPAQTAENFVESFSHGKYEEIKPLVTQRFWEFFEISFQLADLPVHPEYEFKLVKETIDGNTAFVTFIDVGGEESTLELIKIDDVWLVNN